MNIKNIIKPFGYIAFGIACVAGFFIFSVVVPYLQLDCEYNSKIKEVKSLNKDQFNHLFYEFKKLDSSVTSRLSDTDTLGIRYKKINYMHNAIVLGGCFDNTAIIEFHGLADLNETPKIVLSWGGHPLKSEVLWENGKQ